MHYRIIMASGIVIVFLGIVFQFQGGGHIGPESSFMYQNKEWIDYGTYILASGIAVFMIGVLLMRRRI